MIERYDVNEEWRHSGIIKAGDFAFLITAPEMSAAVSNSR